MSNKLTFKNINLTSQPKKLLANDIKENIKEVEEKKQQGRKKSTQPKTERVQIYIEENIVAELKKEWEESGIKGFSNFLVWKMQQKGVFKTSKNS